MQYDGYLQTDRKEQLRALTLVALGAVGLLWARAANSAPAPAISDAELAALANAEAIEIYDERPDKPFDRDTEVRLTGEELAARGAVDLASALALLPDVSVRDVGRGGQNVDIRGARKGAVSVLIDGVLVSDPYYGTFDVTTIPITDIVQIRVATTPQSPIDGPGGPGGVIEVLTRDAIGPQLVMARIQGDTLPSAGVSGTARVALADHWALRLSAAGLGGGRTFSLPTGATLTEGRHTATGSARLEYRTQSGRVAVDGFIDERHYLSPPSDENASATILLIDREATQRGSIKADVKRGKLQLQGQGWVHRLYRRSHYYRDADLVDLATAEDLNALRVGAMALATHPIGKRARWAASANLDYNAISVRNLAGATNHSSLTLAELAIDGQYERGTVRVDAAGGLAIPIVVGGASPWPEGKVVAKWRPNYGLLELDATLARKGRLPSLRERFDPMTGNPALGPEMIDHAELRATARPGGWLRLEAAPFYKHSTGTIRVAPGSAGKLVNLGDLDYYGVDARGHVTIARRLEVGASYGYIRVTNDAIDRLPRHRADGWVRATPVSSLSLLARVRYAGAQVDQTIPLPSYTTVDATLASQLSPRYLAVLRCDDLFDHRPQIRAGYRTDGRVVTLVLQGSWD